QLSFRCGLCGMEYDAPARTDACMSQHNGTRSFGCQGACGDLHCVKTFSSKEVLTRHCRPYEQRTVPCPYCNQHRSRQNMARH
ncbi:hypothetical protein CPB86DRAFT_660581, partial [Serendipita vermifera]